MHGEVQLAGADKPSLPRRLVAAGHVAFPFSSLSQNDNIPWKLVATPEVQAAHAHIHKQPRKAKDIRTATTYTVSRTKSRNRNAFA